MKKLFSFVLAALTLSSAFVFPSCTKEDKPDGPRFDSANYFIVFHDAYMGKLDDYCNGFARGIPSNLTAVFDNPEGMPELVNEDYSFEVKITEGKEKFSVCAFYTQEGVPGFQLQPDKPGKAKVSVVLKYRPEGGRSYTVFKKEFELNIDEGLG